MKRLLSFLLLAALTGTAAAFNSEESTFFDEEDTWNMYSRLGIPFSEVGSDDGFWGSVEVGGILNNWFAAGLRLTSLMQEVEPGFNGYDNPQAFDIMYYGAAFEFTPWARNLVHPSIGFFIGGGQMRLDRTSNGNDEDVDLFVMEPSFNLMVNLTPRSELGLGIGYRHSDTYGSNIIGVDDGSLSGAVGTLFLRLTNF